MRLQRSGPNSHEFGYRSFASQIQSLREADNHAISVEITAYWSGQRPNLRLRLILVAKHCDRWSSAHGVVHLGFGFGSLVVFQRQVHRNI